MQPRGVGGKLGEQRILGARHPHLTLAGQPLEECRAAQRVEMRGDFVEQQHRRMRHRRGDQIGMGEDDAE